MMRDARTVRTHVPHQQLAQHTRVCMHKINAQFVFK